MIFAYLFKAPLLEDAARQPLSHAPPVPIAALAPPRQAILNIYTLILLTGRHEQPEILATRWQNKKAATCESAGSFNFV